MPFQPSHFLRSAVLLGSLLLVAQCASPPPVTKPVPPIVTPAPVEIDDDHKSVSKEEFLQSPWKALPGVESWTREGNGVALKLKDGRTASVTFLTPRNFRLWFPPAVDAVPASPGPRLWPSAPFDLTVGEASGVLVFQTSELRLTVDLATLAWGVDSAKGSLFQASAPSGWKRRLKQGFSLGTAPRWAGLGSAGRGVDKSGQWIKLWSSKTDADGTGPWVVPFLLGVGGVQPFGLLVDNSYQSYFDLDAPSAFAGTLNGGLDLLFWTGGSVSDVIQGLTAVTGRHQRGPDAALGTGLVLPEGETAAFARQAKLSLGQVVLQEPTPEATAAARSTHFFAVSAFTLPQTSDFDPSLAQAVTLPTSAVSLDAVFAPTGWDTRFDDVGRHSLLARANNLFAAWGSQRLWESANLTAPNSRTWVTWRNGATGSGRWGTPEWTAAAGVDDAATLEKVLSAGLSGLGPVQVRLNVEALADPAQGPAAWRGLQTLLLNPYLVLDAGSHPQAWFSGLSDKDKKRLKSMLDKRSALKPTMMEVLRQSALTGAPAIRPLFWKFPADATALTWNNEFLLGDSLLVAPAVDGNPTRKVYLPGSGVWFQWPDGEEFGAGQAYDVPVSPDFPLVFARAGSFIAVREPEAFDEKDTYNPLTFHLYPGALGSGVYWVDDGVSRDYDHGVATGIDFEFTYRGNSMEIVTSVESAGPRMRYSDPYLLLRLHKVYNPKSVKIDGKAIPKYGDSFGITDTDRSAAWYENDNTLLIKIFSPEKPQTISLTF